LAHANLGFALAKNSDWDGAVTEEREALRLNPNLSGAHNILGVALEHKGDRQGAMEEYRAAYTLEPKNATFKQNYERLLRQANR
jgi:Flp pilus assembly protein TadD